MSLYRQSFLLLRRYAVQSFQSLQITETRGIKRWVSPTLKELKRRRDKIGLEPLKPRSSYLEWNYEAELFAFGKRLGEEFDKTVLKQALTQVEYANLQEIKAQEEGTDFIPIKHNVELINEGEDIISNYVKLKYRDLYPEEVTDAVHDFLTSEDMLAHIGKHIGLTDIILTNEFPVEIATLSNTFKAVISALKRSNNSEKAENFVKDFVLSQMNGKDVYEIWNPQQPYDYLTKLLREQGVTDIEPRLCNQSAINTILACFQVGLYSNKKLLGVGWGENLQVAKETAALDAIQRFYSNNKPTKRITL